MTDTTGRRGLRNHRRGTMPLTAERAEWDRTASIMHTLLNDQGLRQGPWGRSMACSAGHAGVAGAMALVLGVVGIYGVILESGLQRVAREFGFQLALGESGAS